MILKFFIEIDQSGLSLDSMLRNMHLIRNMSKILLLQWQITGFSLVCQWKISVEWRIFVMLCQVSLCRVPLRRTSRRHCSIESKKVFFNEQIMFLQIVSFIRCRFNKLSRFEKHDKSYICAKNFWISNSSWISPLLFFTVFFLILMRFSLRMEEDPL